LVLKIVSSFETLHSTGEARCAGYSLTAKHVVLKQNWIRRRNEDLEKK
jgi:hypothetical protein